MGSKHFSQSSSMKSDKELRESKIRKLFEDNQKTVTLNLGEDLIIKKVNRAG